MAEGVEHVVQTAVELSGLNDYAGTFEELGGGEVNDTFLLRGAAENYILRVTRVPGRDTLLKEAKALSLIKAPGVPEQKFFDSSQLIDGRYWILESQVEGETVARLSPAQFKSMGGLLAKVHTTEDPEGAPLQLWAQFIQACRYFGDEDFLLAHPDTRLQPFIGELRRHINLLQPMFDGVTPRLIHGDATPSNILVKDDAVALVDWEFASFSDPMREFSTIYYDDMDFNRGKWRIKITADEKESLFAGYQAAGGEIDEERIDFWMNFDKLTAAIYLEWKLNRSGQDASSDDRQQNEHDLEQLIASLERNLR